MEHVGTDLGAPLYLFLLPFKFGLLLLTLLEFDVVEPGLEYQQSALTVVLLASGLGILDGDAGGDMPHTHTGLDLVDILPAVASGAEGVPFYVAGVDLDIEAVIDEVSMKIYV